MSIALRLRVLLLLLLLPAVPARAQQGIATQPRVPRVAGVATIYRENSHADVILGRLLLSDTLDGRGQRVPLDLVSLYTDQQPETDTSRKLAQQFGFSIHDTVAAALKQGHDSLAVDGVLLIAEHGEYPQSATGQTVYPKRRLFAEVLEVFQQSGRSVPVFIDKHLADNWADAKWIYDAARQHRIPLMAGSSLPTTWRYPPRDVRRGAPLREITAVSYGPLDAYGFHGLEMIQCLAERRAGGETGVQAVRCVTGEAVWQAGRDGLFDPQLLQACIERLSSAERAAAADIEARVAEPVLYHIVYRDGLKANLLTLNGAVAQWAVAWRYADASPPEATLFWVQESRPFMHFAYLVQGISQLVATGESPAPVERTLLTSGLLDALLVSRHEKGRLFETPYLDVAYTSNTDWRQPPPPPGETYQPNR